MPSIGSQDPVVRAAQSQRPLKVIHTAETALGGVGTYIDFLCDVTPDVDNILLIPEGHAELIDPKRDLRSFAYPKRGLRALIRHCRDLFRTYDQEKPDIVFFHSTFALIPLLLLSVLRPKAKTVYCAHGWAVSQYEAHRPRLAKIVAAVEGCLSGFAGRVVNISKYDMTVASRGGYRGQHVLIENAVPDAPSNTVPASVDQTKVNLLFVGRHDSQKGLDILFDAFASATSRRSDLTLYVIGASVRSTGPSLPFPDGAQAVGWVEPGDIDSWYAAMDAIIVPSRWEGFGLVVAEAFRNATPALVSRRGALPDLVDDGSTGAIFDLDADSLSQLLEQVTKTSLQKMRKDCRQVYDDRFSRERFRGNIQSLYADLTT